MPRYPRIPFAIGVSAILWNSTVASGQDRRADNELIQSVIQASKSNAVKLGAISMSVSVKTIPIRDNLDRLPKTVTYDLPGGGSFTLSPLRAEKQDAFEILAGPGFFERRSFTTGHQLDGIWQFASGKWLEYIFGKRLAGSPVSRSTAGQGTN